MVLGVAETRWAGSQSVVAVGPGTLWVVVGNHLAGGQNHSAEAAGLQGSLWAVAAGSQEVADLEIL